MKFSPNQQREQAAMDNLVRMPRERIRKLNKGEALVRKILIAKMRIRKLNRKLDDDVRPQIRTSQKPAIRRTRRQLGHQLEQLINRLLFQKSRDKKRRRHREDD